MKEARKKKETRGGRREGAGAKPLFSEETANFSVRIPVSALRFIKERGLRFRIRQLILELIRKEKGPDFTKSD
jgi:hypothetical protein